MSAQSLTSPPTQKNSVREEKVRCNICGGSKFLPGPSGRLSDTGKKPLCAQCQSLERHRTLRQLYNRLRGSIDLTNFNCLQISDDRCIDPGWFATHVVSIYGQRHSLDIQLMPIASDAFDCLICNHVIEHVPNDLAAMAELIRLISERGFLEIGVPDPLRMSVTDDWGYPRQEDHGHYRKYGIDIVEKFKSLLRSERMIRIVEADPVTGMKDIYFLITKSDDIANKVLELYPDAVVNYGPAAAVARTAPRAPYLHAAPLVRAPSRFADYVVKGGHTNVQGWVTGGALSAVTVFNALQRRLGVNGNVCEIGVHHGRFFIALSLLRQLGEKSLAIDVFDLQEFNVDNSGKGDREAFDRNAESWLGPEADLVVMRADSLQTRGKDVVDALGGHVRLFSVDGSHTCEHTLNDIRIAEESLAPGGLVIVDDFLNPAWPGVVEAVMRYIDGPGRETRLAPIGYGDNKFYFTTKSHLANYRALLDGWLSAALTARKPVVFAGAEMLYLSFPPAEHFLAETRVNPKAFLSGAAGALAVLGAPTKQESAGTWLIGEWAGIALDLSMTPPHSALRLTFETHLFNHDKNSNPKIDVYVYDRPVTDLEVGTDKDITTFVVPINRKDFGNANRLEVWFHNPKAMSPFELGLSNDKRHLSLLLRGLKIEESPSTSQR